MFNEFKYEPCINTIAFAKVMCLCGWVFNLISLKNYLDKSRFLHKHSCNLMLC